MFWSIIGQAVALFRELESSLLEVPLRGDRARAETRLVALVVLSNTRCVFEEIFGCKGYASENGMP